MLPHPADKGNVVSGQPFLNWITHVPSGLVDFGVLEPLRDAKGETFLRSEFRHFRTVSFRLCTVSVKHDHQGRFLPGILRKIKPVRPLFALEHGRMKLQILRLRRRRKKQGGNRQHTDKPLKHNYLFYGLCQSAGKFHEGDAVRA